MHILFRIFAASGLFAIGYYLGKEIGRMESARKALDESDIQSRRLYPSSNQAPPVAGDPEHAADT
ncbi:MAG: hypothetical protein B6D77_03660 [gamma proteobacterium symbiont of Ctena orbiculata]|nr:MAG: hypothetical protein B6D77_03660 [gamma proteobacterium symbiont of Ctena orbiculata]PVV17629.1 MAG: hypothetical protein B6D78_18265 [gamma proteobacterium symbiont of Ctena orbiculata]